MKKFFLLAIFFGLISFSSIIVKLQEIDKLIQNEKYIEAFNEIHELENTKITKEEKKALEELKMILQDKMVVINNNTGNINENAQAGLESISFGTVYYPGDTLVSASDYNKYEQIEKELLSGNQEDKLYTLLRIYMNKGLYERAMRLGLKSIDPQSIYISALAARLIGKNDISIKQYNKVLNSNPEHLNSLLGIAIAYRNKKDFDNAKKYFSRYLNNGGNNPNVINTLKYISQ